MWKQYVDKNGNPRCFIELQKELEAHIELETKKFWENYKLEYINDGHGNKSFNGIGIFINNNKYGKA